MKARLSTVPKKIIRASKKVLKAPEIVLNMPKDILDMSWDVTLDFLNSSLDILENPKKITKVPKQLSRLPVRVLNKMVKKIITINEAFQDSNFLDQESILIGLINKCKKTVFGKQYGFTHIKTIQDFQKQVPLFDYKDFEPRILRMVK